MNERVGGVVDVNVEGFRAWVLGQGHTPPSVRTVRSAIAELVGTGFLVRPLRGWYRIAKGNEVQEDYSNLTGNQGSPDAAADS